MRILPTRVPWPISIIARMISAKTQDRHVQPRLERYLSLADAAPSKHEYLAGSSALTAADITSIYPMDAAFYRYPCFRKKFPYCQAWLERVSQRPNFEKLWRK
mmetsp:Transcript_22616/g.33400  ORF Transcript_22616/g.33400 Transcript_22616/m.33400 type:complete len:103 (+) Transcript_22616:388-696(+)